MTEAEADEVMQPLVIAFNHTDDTLMQWMGLVMDLKDVAAAKRAARSIVKDASNRFVTGWTPFQQSYDRWVLRMEEERREEQLAIDQEAYSKRQFPTYEEGVEIAWKAYCGEVERLGRKPNRQYFDSILDEQMRADRRSVAVARQRR